MMGKCDFVSISGGWGNPVGLSRSYLEEKDVWFWFMPHIHLPPVIPGMISTCQQTQNPLAISEHHVQLTLHFDVHLSLSILLRLLRLLEGI
jgi:hypothetical protein